MGAHLYYSYTSQLKIFIILLLFIATLVLYRPQSSNIQLLDEAEQNIMIYQWRAISIYQWWAINYLIDLWATDKSQYFATAEFNNRFIIQFIIYDLSWLHGALLYNCHKNTTSRRSLQSNHTNKSFNSKIVCDLTIV